MHEFLNQEEIYDILSKATLSSILPNISLGHKGNAAFLIDNSSNLAKRCCGAKGAFYDDCGAWGPNTSCKKITLLRRNEKFLCVTLTKGKYWVGKHTARLKLLDPQPSDDEIFTMCRYY